MSSSTIERDPYCWICHQEGSEVFCSDCEIGFHLHCAREERENVCYLGSRKVFWIQECQQCRRIKSSRNLYNCQSGRKFSMLSKEMLNSTLKLILVKSAGNKSTLAITMMDRSLGKRFRMNIPHLMDMIDSELCENSYTCPEELIFDLKKIRHVIKSENLGIRTEKIDSYINEVEKNCQEMSLCPYCVHNYHLLGSKGLAEPCPWVHQLAWVDLSRDICHQFSDKDREKLKNLPPVFPAKILGYDSITRSVTVRHFGSLMSVKVPKNNVNLLRAADVSRLRTDLKYLASENGKKELEAALEKLDLHLNKLKIIYGQSFTLTDKKRKWVSNDGYFFFRNSQDEELETSEYLNYHGEANQVNTICRQQSRVISDIFHLGESSFPFVGGLDQNIFDHCSPINMSCADEDESRWIENVIDLSVIPDAETEVMILDDRELDSHVVFTSTDQRIQFIENHHACQKIEYMESTPKSSHLANHKQIENIIDLTHDEEEDNGMIDSFEEDQVTRSSVIVRKKVPPVIDIYEFPHNNLKSIQPGADHERIFDDCQDDAMDLSLTASRNVSRTIIERVKA